MNDLSIAILCGGNSSRFGSDKTRAEINGVPLYKRTWNKLRPKSDDVFLQVAPDDEYDLESYPDLYRDGGPLGAIYSALVHAEHDLLFVSACDLPYLEPRIVDELYSEAGEGAEVVIPRWDNGYLEPLTAMYHGRVKGQLEEILASGSRKITDFLDCLNNVEEISVDRLVEEKKIILL
ncbi:molybdenum cofactor guanylyltransferase, partial [Candidatus Bipolaricaulota bacterium]|nr:molybdenum cofactor guanylyltransferase [Candidatus Bipolaricaulota bacterium]